MNSIALTGNLGKDAEVRYLQDGTPVASFSVADNQGRDKPAIWWNCSLFGKRAESLAPYLTKGQQVTVVGNITEREWTDRDGNARKSMDVRVNDLALQGGRRDEGDRREEGGYGAARRTASTRQAPPAEEFDDDIPF